jgi:hypothetical protein
VRSQLFSGIDILFSVLWKDSGLREQNLVVLFGREEQAAVVGGRSGEKVWATFPPRSPMA